MEIKGKYLKCKGIVKWWEGVKLLAILSVISLNN